MDITRDVALKMLLDKGYGVLYANSCLDRKDGHGIMHHIKVKEKHYKHDHVLKWMDRNPVQDWMHSEVK